MLGGLHNLLRSQRGNVAIEFAFIAPLFVVMILGVVDIGKLALERSDMLAAARSGSQYFMAGGTDTSRAETIINSSWTGKPADGVVSVTRVCRCAGVVSACDAVCASGDIPVSVAAIDLSANIDGVFISRTFSSSDEVRLR